VNKQKAKIKSLKSEAIGQKAKKIPLKNKLANKKRLGEKVLKMDTNIM